MIGRFVIRSDGGLLVGAVLKNQELLKPDHVYQISECLGELVITEVGQSIIPENNHDDTEGKTFEYGSWSGNIAHLMNDAGNKMLLSIKEYKEIIEKEE
jgi:hypothetical protein